MRSGEPESGLRRVVVLVGVGVVTALVMTLYEAIKEGMPGQLTPWQSHTVTIIFTSMLAVGVFAFFLRRLEAMHAEARALAQKASEMETHMALMSATNHYMNNALNIVTLIRVRYRQDGQIDPAILDQVETEIRRIRDQIQKLGAMEDPSPDNIATFLSNNI